MRFVWSIRDVNPAQCSPIRRHIATGLGVITLLCAALIVIMVVLGLCDAVMGSKDANYAMIGAFMLFLITSPVASLCTLFALLLVGPRRCKLVWISFCVGYMPFHFCMLVAFICRSFTHSR